MRTIFIIFTALILTSSATAQSGVLFNLNRADSDVSFLISSAMIPIEGRIEKYSGRLIKTGKLSNQFEIYLDCDLSSTKITGEQLQGLPISELMASVKNSTAHFEGKPVSQKPDGLLNISGTLKWRGKAYAVSFPVRIKESGEEIVFEGKVRGSGDQLVEELPLLMMFQVQSASANAKLVFKKSQMNLNSAS